MSDLRIKTSNLLVKLKIKEETRLIRGPSLFKFNGNGIHQVPEKKSYSRLIDVAIKHAQGDDFDIDATSDDFIVKTTYVDADGDVITFSNEDEFIDAVTLIQRPRNVLRVSAQVQKKNNLVREKVKKENHYDVFKDVLERQGGKIQKMKERFDRNNVSHTKDTSKEDTKDTSKEDEVKKDIQEIHERLDHLETLYEALPFLMRAKMRAKVNNRLNFLGRGRVSNTDCEVDHFPISFKELKKECKGKNPPQEAKTKSTSGNASRLCQTESPKESEIFESIFPSNVAAKKTTVEAPKSTFTKQPMKLNLSYHRGIRCDGCDMNPIVGLRYHAKNLPDYDLCDKCHADMKDTNIQFEVFEKPANRKCASKHVEHSPPKKTDEGSKKFNADFVHGRHTCDGCMKSPIVGLRYHALNLKDYDLCSECHAKSKTSDIVFEVAELDRDRGRQEIWKKKLEKHSTLRKNNTHVVSPRKDLEKVVTTLLNELKEKSTKEGMGVKFLVRADKDLFYEGTENTARRVKAGQTFKTHMPTNQSFVSFFRSFCKSNKLRANDLEFFFGEKIEDEDTPTSILLKNRDVISVRMKKPTSKDSESDKISVSLSSSAEDKTTLNETNEKTAQVNIENVEKESIVATDAVKQSPIEDKLGSQPFEITTPSTLKDSISEIECPQGPIEVENRKADLEEEKVSPEERKDEEKQEPDEDLDEKNEEVEEEQVVEDDFDNSKEVISDNLDESKEEKNDELSSGTADEWDMVDNEDDQIQNDEMLAKAAQLIGSALFEEDTSKSDSFYSLSSVESDIPLAVMTRWQNELVKLREIGFLDDKKSVAVLEELQAANIGVDSDDPVQFEKVVDRLLKNSFKDM